MIETLAADPTIVPNGLETGVASSVAGLDLLFDLERLIARTATAADLVAAPPDFASPDAAAADRRPDLVLDLCGDAVPQPGVPVLRPLCLGLPPLEGALAAVLDGRTPVLEVLRWEGGSDPRVVERWAVAVEDRANTLHAVAQILARLAHLAIAAIGAARRPAAEGRSLAPAAVPAGRAPRAIAALAHALEARVTRRLDRLVRRPLDWRVVTRRRDPATDPLAPERDRTPFHALRDDGRRFFADPFLFRDAGRTWLFLEEFPHATGRGILSVAEVDDDGRAGPPRPVLEQDCHLSYPQVFAADGAIYMVPETSGRRTVELWRAVAFPDRWERVAVLVDDVDLGDATLMRRDDGWWMFGCERPWGCSSWDALHVRHAPRLEGPWREIATSPAKVDVASARPAGAILVTPAGLLRPVQDSSEGYGCGLALARIDRLDESGLRETVTKRWRPPAPIAGLHTWNAVTTPSGRIEAMDVFARAADLGDGAALDLSGGEVASFET